MTCTRTAASITRFQGLLSVAACRSNVAFRPILESAAVVELKRTFASTSTSQFRPEPRSRSARLSSITRAAPEIAQSVEMEVCDWGPLVAALAAPACACFNHSSERPWLDPAGDTPQLCRSASAGQAGAGGMSGADLLRSQAVLTQLPRLAHCVGARKPSRSPSVLCNRLRVYRPLSGGQSHFLSG
jgi:hypothetical protein